ncbi:hypothetical protein CC86DRAFT_27464 [Ophiobolus disseminans]|uniref:Uncharacterized protein n=1 Tax=Ophiobolus disseminans TaxID=1469910 RepID=A0A6A6ZYY6_9PLEO|nr:hypothetical protein CC86DRAFT_27464 [Ophiobolus disseminans]
MLRTRAHVLVFRYENASLDGARLDRHEPDGRGETDAAASPTCSLSGRVDTASDGLPCQSVRLEHSRRRLLVRRADWLRFRHGLRATLHVKEKVDAIEMRGVSLCIFLYTL